MPRPKKKTFDPLRIDIDAASSEKTLLEELITKNRLALHKKVVEGIEFCINYRLPKIIHAEGYIGGSKILNVSINSDDFGFHLDKSLKTLEEFEEYEYCAKILQLKELLIDFKPKIPRKKRKASTLNEAIKTL